jgi:hypothetical protein
MISFLEARKLVAKAKAAGLITAAKPSDASAVPLRRKKRHSGKARADA